MKNVLNINSDNMFEPYNFRTEDVLELELFLRDRIKGQDSQIHDIIKVLLNNTVRTEDKPIFFLLIGPSGVGKDYLVKSISEYFSIKTLHKGFKYFEIDVSQYYYAEFKIFTGCSFESSRNTSLFESIIEKMMESYEGTIILNFTEIDKGKFYYGEDRNKLKAFFEPLMQFLENRYQRVKSKSLNNSCVDCINLVIFFSGNFIFDLKSENFSQKIGILDDKELRKQEKDFYKKQKITKNDFLNELKNNLPISVYNRLSADKRAIILMNDIGKDVKKEIFMLEYNKLINKFKSNQKVNKEAIQRFISIDEDYLEDLYKECIKNVDNSEGARGFRNFVNSQIKSYIIETLVENEIESWG